MCLRAILAYIRRCVKRCCCCLQTPVKTPVVVHAVEDDAEENEDIDEDVPFDAVFTYEDLAFMITSKNRILQRRGILGFRELTEHNDSVQQISAHSNVLHKLVCCLNDDHFEKEHVCSHERCACKHGRVTGASRLGIVLTNMCVCVCVCVCVTFYFLLSTIFYGS
jgi:hypothetical protein